MERLTRRFENNGIPYIEVNEGDGFFTQYSEFDETYNVIDALAEYEDLEEEGKMKRIPCKIGDKVYGIRNYRGVKHVQFGTVGDMFFTNQMELMIVVKHVSRGVFGESVFLTYEEAEAKLKELTEHA